MSKITENFRQAALRHGVVVRPTRDVVVPENVKYGAFIEMANLGFRVDPDALSGMSQESLSNMINDARKVIGADRNLRPVYPGFPKQVQELDTVTLIVEQLLHYWTGGEFLPNYADVAREGLPLEDMSRATRVVDVLTVSAAAQRFISKLTNDPVALSEDDRDLLKSSVALRILSLGDSTKVASTASNGENKQVLISAVYNELKNSVTVNDVVASFVPTSQNADQLLRLILSVATTPVEGREGDYERAVTTLSDKDATAVKMVTLSRPVRRALLERLGSVTHDFNADALVARRGLWRRVMRMVHPYSLALSDASRRAVDIIHSNVEYRTFNSAVEEGMAKGNVKAVVGLLAAHQPGNLLRRLVAILRLAKTPDDASALADAVREVGANSTVSTLISAYNGVLVVNSTHARLTRIAGRNNSLRESNHSEVDASYVGKVLNAIEDALKNALAKKSAPKGAVAIASNRAVPLVRRDLSITDRVMDRGQEMPPVGEGDTIRLFSHWVNNQTRAGYMDIGAVVLDAEFNTLAVVTWDSWGTGRSWATYSGDKNVHVGDDAAEYIDVDVAALKAHKNDATWVAMTIQSWSGFPMRNVDIIAGAMLRSEPNSGEPFDARSVTTAFKPTTEALQAVPLVVNLHTGQMVWLDSSSGSTDQGVSAANDDAVGTVVYDEIARPRLTMGALATLWAEAHNAETVDEAVDREVLLALLG